jgi:protoporphyrinogen/coproporphyrinogen III oxidase
MVDSQNPDVIIVGGGIAGLTAAITLQDHGLKPLVLESEARVGGRMTTDRKDGFVIDRGVTLLGNRFTHMLNLSKRFGLGSLIRPTLFSFGLQTSNDCHGYRAARPEDILFSRRISFSSKVAILRFYLDVFKHRRGLIHGRSDLSASVDDLSSFNYFSKYGKGGLELFRDLIEPGLKAPVGGMVADSSRAILMQTFWNVLATGSWNLTDGVDRIPETFASQVSVLTKTKVFHVKWDKTRVTVSIENEGEIRSFESRAVIFAIPGQLIPNLCDQLPDWVINPLKQTTYAKMANVHVALRSPPRVSYATYSFTKDVFDGVELELEHHRAPGRCPDGKGLISAYFFNSPTFKAADLDDGELVLKAIRVIEHAFPECKNQVLFTHCIRWPIGVAQFPPGRLRDMIQLRENLSSWDVPVDFCGDYLDGISSEGALRTGEQAAERLVNRLKMKSR